MKKILAVIMMMAVMMGAFIGVGEPVWAASNAMNDSGVCKNGTDEERELAGCTTSKTAPNVALAVINVAIGILGVVSVIVIVIAGINYVTSNGDPGKAGKATKAIIYAVVGLVVAILSWAIVNFVSGKL